MPVWLYGSSAQAGVSCPLCSGGDLPCRTRLLLMEGWICLPQCGGDCEAFSSPDHVKRVVTCPWNLGVLWSEEGLSKCAGGQKLFTHFCVEEVSQKQLEKGKVVGIRSGAELLPLCLQVTAWRCCLPRE